MNERQKRNLSVDFLNVHIGVFVGICLFIFFPSLVWSGSVSFTTYFPPPRGAYDHIQLVPQSQLSDPCNIGSLYVNESNNTLYFCFDNSGEGNWGPISGVWQEDSSQNVFLTDYASSDVDVGIGLNNPTSNLHIRGDTPINIDWNATGVGAPRSGFPLTIENEDAYIQLVGENNSTGISGIKMAQVDINGNYMNTWGICRVTNAYNNKLMFNYTRSGEGTGGWFAGLRYAKMTLQPNGYVGIGTSTPYGALQVQDRGPDIGRIIIENNDGVSKKTELVLYRPDMSSLGWWIGTDGSETGSKSFYIWGGEPADCTKMAFEQPSGDIRFCLGNTATNQDRNMSIVGNSTFQVALGIYNMNPNVKSSGYQLSSGNNYIWSIESDFFKNNQHNFSIRNALNNGSSGNVRLFIDGNGNVGIGTTIPTARLQVAGNIKAELNNIAAVTPHLYKSGTREIGYDAAELFEVSGPVEQGDVLVMDKQGGFKLRKSCLVYEKGIIGIVSASPAILFEGSELQIAPSPGLEENASKVPVALAGRVPCKVTLENGSIAAGDLLTTSSTPGHAMKVVDRKKAFGAVIGKAAQSFEGSVGDGKTGIITVLVMTQ